MRSSVRTPFNGERLQTLADDHQSAHYFDSRTKDLRIENDEDGNKSLHEGEEMFLLLSSFQRWRRRWILKQSCDMNSRSVSIFHHFYLFWTTLLIVLCLVLILVYITIIEPYREMNAFTRRGRELTDIWEGSRGKTIQRRLQSVECFVSSRRKRFYWLRLIKFLCLRNLIKIFIAIRETKIGYFRNIISMIREIYKKIKLSFV